MKPCEYFLVEYVPFPRAELRLPIGLILLEQGGGLVRHAMTPDWRAVRCLDPRADMTLLRRALIERQGLMQVPLHAKPFLIAPGEVRQCAGFLLIHRQPLCVHKFELQVLKARVIQFEYPAKRAARDALLALEQRRRQRQYLKEPHRVLAEWCRMPL